MTHPFVVRDSNQYHKANTRNAPTPPPVPTIAPASTDTANPYTSGSATAANDKGFEGAPRERAGRSFRFNQKGKYVHIANQMRQQQQMEQLKQRIAESARKAGLDTEFETLEKNIKVVSNRRFMEQFHSIPWPYSAKFRQRLNGGTNHCSQVTATRISREGLRT